MYVFFQLHAWWHTLEQKGSRFNAHNIRNSSGGEVTATVLVLLKVHRILPTKRLRLQTDQACMSSASISKGGKMMRGRQEGDKVGAQTPVSIIGCGEIMKDIQTKGRMRHRTGRG